MCISGYFLLFPFHSLTSCDLNECRFCWDFYFSYFNVSNVKFRHLYLPVSCCCLLCYSGKSAMSKDKWFTVLNCTILCPQSHNPQSTEKKVVAFLLFVKIKQEYKIYSRKNCIFALSVETKHFNEV